MSTGFYRPVGGFFEQTHPVTRIVCLIMAFLPPFWLNRPVEVLLYAGILVFAALLAGAIFNLRRMGTIMALLFVMTIAIWALFGTGGRILFHAWILRISTGGILHGTTIGLRLICFVLAAAIFLTCTRVEDFTYGLSKLGMPFVVAFTLALAFRLTPLFMETGRTIAMAQRARGLDLDAGGPIARLRRHIPVIVPVLVSGLRRADQLAVALESKGFGCGAKRTMLSVYRVTWRDGLLLAALVSIIALSAWIRRAGGM